jgi:uncharacterized protein YegL
MSTRNNIDWSAVELPPDERYLPVYLLLDTSQSMEGAPIQALQLGLEQFQREVSDDSFAKNVGKVGLITFGSDAELVTDGLVPLSSFQPPELVAGGVTRLDRAFEKLLESMDRDVTRAVRGEDGHPGDYKPIVFVLIGGQPTDKEGNETDGLWKPAREALVNRPRGKVKPSAIVAVSCGLDMDDVTLKSIAYTRPRMADPNPPTYAFRISSNEASFVGLFYRPFDEDCEEST